MTAHAAFGLSIEELDIAVVDNSRAMQALICSMLAADRVHRIRVFEGAEEAMEAMRAEPPHLILSEWRMKPITGYQLLRALRRPDMAPLAFVPFIMMSAFATRAVVELTYRAGVHAFLVKPLAPHVLRQAIKRVLADTRQIIPGAEGYALEGVSERLADMGAGEDASSRARPAMRREPSLEPLPEAPAMEASAPANGESSTYRV